MPGRGRGRGGLRGRGRGRGRGRQRGRGRGRGQEPDQEAAPYSDWEMTADDTSPDQEMLDINKDDVTKFFIGTASFDQHYNAQNTNKVRYAAAIDVLDKNGVDISQSE